MRSFIVVAVEIIMVSKQAFLFKEEKKNPLKLAPMLVPSVGRRMESSIEFLFFYVPRVVL